jgi:hypothetical protein
MEPNNEHEFTMMQMLGDIRADVATTKEAVIGLAGPTGRVTALEEAAKTANTRQWYHTAVVIPLVTTAHLVAKHFGF